MRGKFTDCGSCGSWKGKCWLVSIGEHDGRESGTETESAAGYTRERAIILCKETESEPLGTCT